MIFNTFSYYLLFLVPAAILFRLAPQPLRSWVIVPFVDHLHMTQAAAKEFSARFGSDLPQTLRQTTK